MVTRGVEQRGGPWSALAGWEFERPPRLREPRFGRRTHELSSVLALIAAAAIAAAAVFLNRPDAAPAVQPVLPPSVAAAATATAPAEVPPPASTASAAAGPQARAAAAPQADLDQTAVNAALAAELRAGIAATPQQADQQIRAYLGLSAAAALPPAFSYTVQAGDTVSKIAARFGLEAASIRFNNFEIYDPDLLETGAALQLPVRDGVIYVVQGGDTLDAVLANYEADMEATLAFAGNGITSPDQIWVGQTLLLVGGSASVAAGGGSAFTSNAAWTMPSFRWPMAVNSISDPFGTPRANSYGYHTGIDWPAPQGTIVGSTAPGAVSFAGWDAGYGYWVEVDHGGGVRSRYAHLSEIFVVVGEWVDALDFVGAVGATGNSSGTHLHFEIIMQGEPQNPMEWLE